MYELNYIYRLSTNISVAYHLKVFEKVLQEQLTEFLNVNKLLYNTQYGFRKAQSKETATLELIDTLLQTLDKQDIRHYGINWFL